MRTPYLTEEQAPSRADVDALPGAVLVEFGTDWCGHCQLARPFVQAAFDAHPDVRHVKVEDGRGRRLGRTFGVKLWPTLVFLRDGTEVARVVRPTDRVELDRAFNLVDPG